MQTAGEHAEDVIPMITTAQTTECLEGTSRALMPGRVSVVIIFLNEARFLREAIESVLRQTHVNWEMLLIDDGSTDESSNIAKQYVAAHPGRARYLEHPGHANRGMSASRNLGLTHARGEFLLFLDGDDVVVPTTLEDQITFMDAYPQVGTVYGPMREWHSWSGSAREADANGNPTAKANPHPDKTTDLHLQADCVHDQATILSTFLLHEDAVPSGNLIRTALARELGGFEDEFTGMYEDQVFRVKLCRSAPAYVSSRVWYYYRKHRDSCCAIMVVEGRVAAARQRFLQWVRTYCGRFKMVDPRVRRALAQALRPYRYPRLARWLIALERLGQRGIRYGREVASWLGRFLLPPTIWKAIRDLVRSEYARQESLIPPVRMHGFSRARMSETHAGNR